MSYTFIAYCRKSSEGESRQSASILDQETLLKDLQTRDGLDVVDWLDEAHSAKSPNTRPVFRTMIERILSGEADSILCWHLNRLARNPLEAGELQWLLQDGKIRCIKTPEREYHPEDQALLMAVESSMASQYVRDLKRDVDRGLREKAARGWYPFKRKVGYSVDSVSKEIIVDPFRFALIRRAWEAMLTGAYSVPQILDSLNAAGFRLPRTKARGEKLMNRSSLYRLFNDRFYAGFFTFEGVERIGRHQAMVSPQEFDRVQRLLGNPDHGKEQKFFHAYAGFLRCGTCGCRVTPETHIKRYKTTGTTREYTYYHCTGRRGCPKTSVTEEYLEGQILGRLEGCRPDPHFVDWALGILAREEREAAGVRELRDPAQPQAAAALTKKIDRLFDMREAREISAAEFQDRKRGYEQQVRLIQADLKDLAEQPRRTRDRLQKFLVFSRDAYERFTGEDPTVKRVVARGFAQSYVLTLGTLEITPNPGHDRLRTFELPKNRDHQIDSDDPGASNIDWLRLLEELRSLMVDSNPETSEN